MRLERPASSPHVDLARAKGKHNLGLLLRKLDMSYWCHYYHI